jgi:hypothetical protein
MRHFFFCFSLPSSSALSASPSFHPPKTVLIANHLLLSAGIIRQHQYLSSLRIAAILFPFSINFDTSLHRLLRLACSRFSSVRLMMNCTEYSGYVPSFLCMSINCSLTHEPDVFSCELCSEMSHTHRSLVLASPQMRSKSGEHLSSVLPHTRTHSSEMARPKCVKNCHC